jgi:hypothetical protein
MSSTPRPAVLRTCAVLLVVLCSVSVASAVVGLAGHPLAYNDGNGPAAGAWTGSTPFVKGTLQGYVDWAVFGPGVFPYAGYTPTGGELTYAYQIYETGTAPLSSFAVALTDLGDNIGTFNDLSGNLPASSSLVSMASATWQFSGIPSGGNSQGLAFSSVRVPQTLFGVVIDTGQSQYVVPLPSPSSTSIPEPGSILALGASALMLAGRRRSA